MRLSGTALIVVMAYFAVIAMIIVMKLIVVMILIAMIAAIVMVILCQKNIFISEILLKLFSDLVGPNKLIMIFSDTLRKHSY